MSEKAQSLREWSRDLGLPEPDIELLSEVAVERIAALRAERDAMQTQRDSLHEIAAAAIRERDALVAERDEYERLYWQKVSEVIALVDEREGDLANGQETPL